MGSQGVRKARVRCGGKTDGKAEPAPHPTGPGSTTPAERQLKLLSSMVTLWTVSKALQGH